MCVCPTIHPIPRSHGTMGHFTGYPTVLHSDMCIPLSIPSHNPMGHSTGCPPVPLKMCLCVCHIVHPNTIPWDHRIFHGMSTCPSQRCVYVTLSIPSHDPIGHSTGCPPVFLIGECVSHVHLIPQSHGNMGHCGRCPPVPLNTCVSVCL